MSDLILVLLYCNGNSILYSISSIPFSVNSCSDRYLVGLTGCEIFRRSVNRSSDILCLNSPLPCQIYSNSVQTQNITDTFFISPKNLTSGKSYKVAIAARVHHIFFRAYSQVCSFFLSSQEISPSSAFFHVSDLSGH